jgi:hypothetical protein
VLVASTEKRLRDFMILCNIIASFPAAYDDFTFDFQLLNDSGDGLLGYIQQNIDKYKSTPQKIREIASKILKESEDYT